MTEREPDFSRIGRKRNRNRTNKLLNLLIGAVVVSIIIVAITLFAGGKTDEDAIDKNVDSSIGNDDSTTEDNKETDSTNSPTENLSDADTNTNGTDASDASNETTSESKKEDEKADVEQSSAGLTAVPSDDSTVSQSIIDDTWKPVGTSQTGEHVSLYDGKSVDWNEKKQALAYATGLPADSMIFWKIKNGGGPQKSIGIVSSRDSKEKYRVYLEWVDGEGWKPVKKDILTTLEVND